MIFCDMDNGKTYPMPLVALDRAEDWNPQAKPKAAGIIHDGYAAFVKFDTKVAIDFPADFVLHNCEPVFTWYKDKARAMSGIGCRIREIRESRGLTLDALAAKCGIAKPNLSRLEHDKVTPRIETLRAVFGALKVNPALQFPKYALTATRHEFGRWKLSLLHRDGAPSAHPTAVELVRVFLARRTEHKYARPKLLKHVDRLPNDPKRFTVWLDADKWARELAAARGAEMRTNREHVCRADSVVG